MPDADDLSDVPLVDGIWGYIVYTEHVHGPESGTITIERADPRALVHDEILNEVFVEPKPIRSSMLRLQPPGTGFCNGGPGVCEYPSHPFCYTDWLLHIDIPGRHLVYRIGKYRLADNCWEATWPD